MSGRFDLPDSPRKLVFRRIVQQLRNDPVLRRTLKAILAWEGRPTDSQQLTSGNAPGIRLTPTCGPSVWATPDSHTGWLFIAVDILVPGYDVGDMLDVWWAIERAIYPLTREGRNKFQKDLREVGDPHQASGATTGQIEFSQPAATDSPADQCQQYIAQMKVEVRLAYNA